MKVFAESTLKRMIKTKREIGLLKKSAAITDSCIPIIEDALKERITEKELARRIRKNIKSRGASQAFMALVASGKRAAQVHPRPYASKKRIAGLGYVDFGAKYKGYRTDITVPFLKGGIGKRERGMLDSTIQAYRAAVKSIKVGEYCWKVHSKAEGVLKRHGFEIPHAIGHGLGKNIHELPYIGKLNRKRLNRLSKKKRAKALRRWGVLKQIKFQPGMVFTIEPAVYVKGLGGCRLENDFLMTSRGLKRLTNARLIKSG
jgi:Xaa-Pro aminopeptidase